MIKIPVSLKRPFKNPPYLFLKDKYGDAIDLSESDINELERRINLHDELVNCVNDLMGLVCDIDESQSEQIGVPFKSLCRKYHAARLLLERCDNGR